MGGAAGLGVGLVSGPIEYATEKYLYDRKMRAAQEAAAAGMEQQARTEQLDRLEKTAAYIIARGPGGQMMAYDPTQDERLMNMQQAKINFMPAGGAIAGSVLGGGLGAATGMVDGLRGAAKGSAMGAGIGALGGLSLGLYQKHRQQAMLDALRGN